MSAAERQLQSLLRGLTQQSLASISSTIVSGLKAKADPSSFATVSTNILSLAIGADAPRELYVRLVLDMQARLQDSKESATAVKKSLLTAVQGEYETIWSRTVKSMPVQGDSGKEESQDQPVILPEHRARWLGFMEFFGLLYVHGLLAEVVLRTVLDRFQQLRGSPDENLVEGVCQLLLTEGVIAKLISTERGSNFMMHWQRGSGRLHDFSKSKTKYLKLKPRFESIFELLENGGQYLSKDDDAQDAGGDFAVVAGKDSKGKHVANNTANRRRIGSGGSSDAVANDVAPPGGSGGGSSERPTTAFPPREIGSPHGAAERLGDRGGLGEETGGYFDANRKGGKGDRNGKNFGGKGGEPDARQLFVAGIGNNQENEIRTFFSEVGDVERVKILRTPEGDSKGVCFVSFRTDEQALQGLKLHGAEFYGQHLTVRVAHGGKDKGKGDRSLLGGPAGANGYDRGSLGFDRDRGDAFGDRGAPDLGGAARFAGLRDNSPDHHDSRGDRGGMAGASGKGNKARTGKGKPKGEWMAEVEATIEEILRDSDGPVKVSDFDFTAKRFLFELRHRDRTNGDDKFHEAVESVINYTSGKERSDVRKWSAYVFKLLQNFDPDLSEELKKRDEERRRERTATEASMFEERRERVGSADS
eukprot:TRINITY_DN20944_c0_g1_i1.p1 TRINITY_DN20944_c0_g1~~TRINITY_DN20944_c0_g1_i1.p1  ORF type:complete len:645 (-),score=165.35 TRINITY_DN20944_c0_g1_i1:161-2095(-)